MSAVSNKVMPRSMALWITLREVSRSVRWPKLLQPGPTADTRRREPPRLRICMIEPVGWNARWDYIVARPARRRKPLSAARPCKTFLLRGKWPRDARIDRHLQAGRHVGVGAVVAGQQDELEHRFFRKYLACLGPERIADRSGVMEFVRQADQHAVAGFPAGIIGSAEHRRAQLALRPAGLVGEVMHAQAPFEGVAAASGDAQQEYFALADREMAGIEISDRSLPTGAEQPRVTRKNRQMLERRLPRRRQLIELRLDVGGIGRRERGDAHGGLSFCAQGRAGRLSARAEAAIRSRDRRPSGNVRPSTTVAGSLPPL